MSDLNTEADWQHFKQDAQELQKITVEIVTEVGKQPEPKNYGDTPLYYGLASRARSGGLRLSVANGPRVLSLRVRGDPQPSSLPSRGRDGHLIACSVA